MKDPFSAHGSQNSGRRIPHLDKIPRDDPDRIEILLTVNRFELAGIEIDDRAVEIATKFTRWDLENRAAESQRLTEELLARRAAEQERECWVYFVRVGRLVKIGMSTNLAARFTSIRPNEVLAIHPGGLRDESELHQQFADLRAGGEYFHPGPALQEHINELRRELGPPNWTRSLVPDGQDWFPAEAA